MSGEGETGISALPLHFASPSKQMRWAQGTAAVPLAQSNVITAAAAAIQEGIGFIVASKLFGDRVPREAAADVSSDVAQVAHRGRSVANLFIRNGFRPRANSIKPVLNMVPATP